MNVKLVIAWVFAIIVFAIFGVFGYMNRDLLVKDDSNTDFTPIVNNEVIVHNCKKETNKGTLNYKYIVRDNKIEKTTVTFTAREVNLSDYISANNINNLVSEGVTTSLKNGSADFIISVTIDHNINSYDFTSIQSDLNNLEMSLSKIDDYENAKINLGTSFTCE